MLRFSCWVTVLAVIFAGAGAVQAEGTGTGAGGHGINASSPGGIGRSSGDGLSSTGFSGGAHAGGLGLGQSVSSNNLSRASGDTFSAGYSVHSPGGIGRGTDYVTSEKLPSLPVIHGIGSVASTPGGRGL
jgi:hypothetical protein